MSFDLDQMILELSGPLPFQRLDNVRVQQAHGVTRHEDAHIMASLQRSRCHKTAKRGFGGVFGTGVDMNKEIGHWHGSFRLILSER